MTLTVILLCNTKMVAYLTVTILNKSTSKATIL